MTQKTEKEIIDAELSYIAATENKRGSTRAESAYSALKPICYNNAIRILDHEIAEAIEYSLELIENEIKTNSIDSISEYLFYFKRNVKKACAENNVAYTITDEQAYSLIKQIVLPD